MSGARFFRRGVLAALMAAPLVAGGLPALAQQKEVVLRAVMHSDLKILDPVWTTAYIVRNHGYMIYDTLFAMDEKFQVKPQMVDKWEVSTDKLTYTFTLRPGLQWHDGQPVTAEDCIASIRRWGSRDTMGQKLLSFVREMTAVDQVTFRIELTEPYGLVLESLGKPSGPPFMMPKRVAETPGSEQISDTTGSGPFIFKREEWKPGEKAVYVRNPAYRPRAEPPSGLAGGKVVKLDRVEWIPITDQQTAINALLAGEVDMVEQPSHDLLPILEKDKAVKLVDWNKLGYQYTTRLNWTAKPFDNEKIRQAVLVALNQEDSLKAVIGDPRYYKVCKSIYPCGTPLASDAGMADRLESKFDLARKLLQEGGYDGTPIVLLHTTDIASVANLGPVARDLLQRAGFKVDMQDMDWQTVVARRAKKDPPDQGGWHIMQNAWGGADILNPVMIAFLNASCDKALFGWPCDSEVEKLRDAFAREGDPARQREIATKVQERAMTVVTHIPLGLYFQPSAMRANVAGMLVAPVPVFWEMTKQ